MSHELFIQNLTQKNSDYNNPEQAITTANLCETISRDINTDSQRFIYELLQNADDASNQNDSLDIQIDFVDSYVIVSHKGEAFSKIDIESISSAGDGTKTGDSNKTGFKGIGFKSVFSHSNFVIIKSKDFCFKFDKFAWKDHWNNNWGLKNDWQSERREKQKNEQLKMPWQIIPISTDLPAELKNLSVFQEYNVSTVIKYDKVEHLKIELSKLFSESQIVLFLRSKKAKIVINGATKIILEKSKNGETTKLKRNGNLLSEWLIKTEQFDIPNNVLDEINADEKSPKKLKEAKRTEISFAIQLEKGKLKAVDKEKRLIFTYLPTSINYDFPFLVNASFLTDAGRQHLHQDIYWNKWIFEQIPIKFVDWIAELAHKSSIYNKQFLAVFPQKLNGHNDLEKSFNKGYKEAIDTIAFVPNLNGDLLKVSETIFDKTNISNFISKQTVINFINQKTQNHFSVYSFIPYLDPLSTLSRLGTEMFEVEDLEGFFASKIFEREHELAENFKLISFLYEQAQKGKGEENSNIWNEKLRNTPFIFDENQKLKSPNHIYFPAAEFSDNFGEDISIIQEDIILQINENQRIKSWLEFLGVREPSDLSFIEKTIIGEIGTFITESNALQIGRYLYGVHKKALLSDKHYEGLQKLKLITQKNSLCQAQDSFLSNFYKPNLELESTYSNDIFVTESYYEKKDLISEWKTFLLKIGVKETISWNLMKRTRAELSSKYPIYFNSIPSGCPHDSFGYKNDFSEYRFNLLSFIEYANNYDFSKKFWSIIFSKNIEIKKGKIDTGVGYYLDKIESLNNWIINNSPIIPATTKMCLVASNVYSNNIPQITEIAGKYLPVFDCKEAVPPDWQNYLKFKLNLVLDNYLEILSAIWQDIDISEDEQKVNHKRILLIYEKLSSMNLHSFEKEKIKKWSTYNKLLSKNGNTFFYPKDLSIVTVEGFKAANLAYLDKFDNVIIDLLRLFGVSVIDKVTETISNSKVEIEDLKHKLVRISPLVALISVEKSKNQKDWENEYYRVKNKLSNIHFFQASEIYLSYGNEDDKQKRSSWAKGDNFYYVGDWFSPRVLDGLVEPLCKFLNIRYAERILNVLLLETFADGLEYLQEKGYDISLIPEILRNPKELESPVINQGNRTYNQSDEDLGKLGEQFVYEELKKLYTQKYEQSIEETQTGFKVGNQVEVFWRNISANTTENHDFKVVENGKDIYIESKATPYAKNIEKVSLYISGNELALMETAKKYLLARVYNVTDKDNISMELIKLKIDKLN